MYLGKIYLTGYTEAIMKNAQTPAALSLPQPGFWFLLLGAFAIFFVASFLFGISPFLAPGVTLALLAFAFLRQPLWLLGILLISRMSLDYISQTKRLFVNDQISFSLSQLVGVFLLVLSLGLFFVYRDRLKNFALWKPFALLIAFGIASAFVSFSPLTSLQEIARLVSIFAIGFLAFLSVSQPSDVKKIFFFLLLSSVLPFLVALSQLFTGAGMADSSFDAPRIFGTFAHPNVLALYLYSMCVTAALLFFWPARAAGDHSTPKGKKWLIIYSLLALFLLLLTFTRVAWIAAFLFIFAVALWRYRVLLIPLILFPLVLIISSGSVRERVLESFETNPDSSIIWRQEIWQDVTAKLAVDNQKVLGTGLDTFTQYAENLRGTRFGSTDAHNDFVKFYVEGGYVGLAIFLAFLALIAWNIKSLFTLPLPYRPLAILFSFYAFTLLLSSFSDNVYKDTPIQWVFTILLGALLGLKSVTAQKS